jgi:two-component system, response regulator, stage 0 sporulation protein F
MTKPLGEKWVLIVDDEEAILSVLQKSLKKLGDDYQVVTATDGLAALEQLKNRRFDLVVTDYKMAGMNGLELLQAIRTLQPEVRIILMTAYGNDKLEAETRRHQAYQYLTKPLELDTFRQIVRGAFEDVAISRPGILILSDERYLKINEALTQLQVDVGARCIFLTNPEGHFLAKIGDMRRLPLEQIACLVGGSVATLLEAGRIIDGEDDTINLTYREGKRDNLYVVNIGIQLLLIIVSERGTYSSKLGTVWYYAQKTALALRRQLGEAEYASPSQVLMEDLEQATGGALDELFDNAWSGFDEAAPPRGLSKR